MLLEFLTFDILDAAHGIGFVRECARTYFCLIVIQIEVPYKALTAPMTVTARARYNQKEQPATVYPEENGLVKVVFHQPQRAMTPGQAVVLYQGDMVVGGGTITETFNI